MRAQGYRQAVAWIALNDSPADKTSAEDLAGYVTVCLVADLYGKQQEQVARDVFAYRERDARSGTNDA